MMGIITENKSINLLIDKMGVNGTINFLGGIDNFKNIGGVDYLFNKSDELLKDYTNLIIVDDYEDDSRDSYKSVAYGEGHDDYRIKPGYVYFNWSKTPMDAPTARLSVDKALSNQLIPLDIPDEITKIILERWVRKYYDNIPPIDRVTFGSNIGYGNDDEPKPMRTDIVNPPIIPRETPKKISKDEIIKLLKDTAKEYPKEEYDDLLDWMGDIFSIVSNKIEDEGIDVDEDKLRDKYDYVLTDIWGPSEYTQFINMRHNLR